MRGTDLAIFLTQEAQRCPRRKERRRDRRSGGQCRAERADETQQEAQTL